MESLARPSRRVGLHLVHRVFLHLGDPRPAHLRRAERGERVEDLEAPPRRNPRRCPVGAVASLGFAVPAKSISGSLHYDQSGVINPDAEYLTLARGRVQAWRGVQRGCELS